MFPGRCEQNMETLKVSTINCFFGKYVKTHFRKTGKLVFVLVFAQKQTKVVFIRNFVNVLSIIYNPIGVQQT